MGGQPWLLGLCWDAAGAGLECLRGWLYKTHLLCAHHMLLWGGYARGGLSRLLLLNADCPGWAASRADYTRMGEEGNKTPSPCVSPFIPQGYFRIYRGGGDACGIFRMPMTAIVKQDGAVEAPTACPP